ncbi:MAG: undecaprenyldiphospho-muramoylpentapeptide beta-N-acetylglucosaminyltransferase [Desulfovibrionaceae bacterium]
MNGLNRLIVTTGGTGGHVFPALAVADAARRRNPDCRVLFAGGSGPEGDMARKAGLEFEALPARGVLGTGPQKLLAPFWLLGGMLRSLGLLRRFRPEAVIGFGGYAGFCPVLAARMLSIPSAVHEQNSVPGAANRTLGRFCDTIFASFEENRPWFPARKLLVTGNPVRPEISAVPDMSDAPGRNLLILGGSQGAKALNDAMIEALPQLLEAKVRVLHQAGRADEARVRAAYALAGADPDAEATRVRGFMDDMAAAYAWADLILCRSGASTVFEAAAAGRPCVFVPFPHATHDHQARNAQSLSDLGAARLLPQTELDGPVLAALALGLLDNPQELRRMGAAARGFAKPDAARAIIEAMEKLVTAKHKARHA